MVKTTTKTKTAVAVGIAVIAAGSLAAGIYYYGARILKNPEPQTTRQQAQQQTQQGDNSITAPPVEKLLDSGVGVIGGDSSSAPVQYGIASVNIPRHGRVDPDSTTLDYWCKEAGFDGATGMVTTGAQPDMAKTTALLVASGEKIIEQVDQLGNRTYSAFGNYLKNCEEGSACRAQCYIGDKAIAAVDLIELARTRSSVDNYCKNKGYEGATGIVSSLGNKYISQISDPAGGAEFDPNATVYDQIYWCAYANQACFAQCYNK